MTHKMEVQDAQPRSVSWWQQWPYWAGYAAGIWSLLYGLLGIFWAFGGVGFPFGTHDQAVVSVLSGLSVELGAPVIAAVGFTGAVVAVLMRRTWDDSRIDGVLVGFAVVVAVILALIIPDYRALMAVAYAPIFLLGAPFGWPPVSFSKAIPWPVLNQLLCIAGGGAWGAAALAYWRRTRARCLFCGRSGANATWTTAEAAARWGRWAVAIAVSVPTLYAITRWAWALGIPLGVDQAFLNNGQSDGFLWAGAGLATVALAGAGLTLGLIQPWGERFPRWLPYLAGKRVPPALAIIPASLIAILVTEAGLMYNRLWLSGFFPPDNPAIYAPELLWPLWGASLAAATRAYALRRRGSCAWCGGS